MYHSQPSGQHTSISSVKKGLRRITGVEDVTYLSSANWLIKKPAIYYVGHCIIQHGFRVKKMIS